MLSDRDELGDLPRNPIPDCPSPSESFSQDSESLFGDPDDSYRVEPAYGLQWISTPGVLLPKPEWTVQPTIHSINKTLQQAVDPFKQYNVHHLWDGTYTKIYDVSYDGNHLVMRIFLPVCPRIKTESEVATLRWVYKNTNLPVPKVKCYDASCDNPIGFEWILMDRIDGQPLSQCWCSVTQDAKERIVKQVAEYASIAFKMQFRGIGNVYASDSPSPVSQPPVGGMVSMALF